MGDVFLALNGIPWYYSAATDNHTLSAAVPSPVHIVLQTASARLRPGVVQVNSPKSFFRICEPSGEDSQRARRLAAALAGGDAQALVCGNMRREIWIKLLGNVSFNPVSVLTRGTVAGMANHPVLSEAVIKPIIIEALEVAAADGVDTSDFPTIEARLDAVRGNHHPPSMLQDFLAGSEMEIDAILTSVQTIARRADVKTPTIDLIFALVIAADTFRLTQSK